MPRRKTTTTTPPEPDYDWSVAAQEVFGDMVEPEPDWSLVPAIDDQRAETSESAEAAERAVEGESTGEHARAVADESTDKVERAEDGKRWAEAEALGDPEFRKSLDAGLADAKAGLTVEREFRPGIGDMITVKGGGLYLPVRRRVGWMRGYPVPHPDWTIDTIAEKVVEGTFKKVGGKDSVEGGYARYRANIFDATGRLIASGTKTEYSERFLDFVEKCETGAIGRALAVTGYGTEAAVDLDEGLEQERIADAPVIPSRPINISSSAIPGVRPGGRPAHIENTQVREIARLNRALGLGIGLISLMEAVKGEPMDPLTEGSEQKQMLDFLGTFTHEQAGDLIMRMTRALNERQQEEASGD
jgi:hypothetical protein